MPNARAAEAAAALKAKQVPDKDAGATNGNGNGHVDPPADPPAPPVDEAVPAVVDQLDAADAPAIIVHRPPDPPDPVLDRVGLDPVIPAPPPTPPEVTPEPEAPAPPAAPALSDVEVDAVLATVPGLPDSVWSDVPQEAVRERLRTAVQAAREAFAVGQASGLLPRRDLSLIIVVRANDQFDGPVRVAGGDVVREREGNG